jgi:DNA-binding NarL/FixJ family response regulator
MHPYRIILVDDHKMFRQGVKQIIEKREDLKVIGEAGDGLELLSLLKKVSPDMIILDISMPKMRGIETAKEIKALYRDIKLLMLTMHKNPEYLQHAILSGAEGYLLKEDAHTDLFSAIDTIKEGRAFISPILSRDLTDDLFQIFRGKYQPLHEPLTTREKEVLKLIADGKSSNEVAELLCISIHTVHNHRAKIMTKLNIKKTADLIKYAIRKGYTPLDG